MSEETAEHEALLGGKYRLLRLLAKGGMGTVYAAEEVPSGRKVAVKLLNESASSDSKAAQRLYTEAHAASAVGHPNIVEVYELGQTYNGTPFLVMELLEGQSLADVLQLLGKLDPGYGVDIIAQILSALAAAHEKSIVHRDLKPQNIFLCPDAIGGTKVKILDFGISKMWTDDYQLHLTQTGFVVGTPYYMSPEHARGAKDIDGQTDIWAVGVVLYQILTGRLPYEGETYNELLAKILNEPFPRPREIAPTISPALEHVVLEALAKEREDRYRTASQFRAELLSVAKLTADPHDKLPQRKSLTRAPKRKRAWRWAVMGGIAVTTLIMGSLTGLLLYRSPPQGQVDDELGKQEAALHTMPSRPLQPPWAVVELPECAPRNDVDEADRPAKATERAETVELHVKVRPDSRRTEVFVNGLELNGGHLQVSPGIEHLIAISSPGYQPAQIKRAITQDTVIEVQLTPVRRSSDSRSSRNASKSRNSTAQEPPQQLPPIRHRPLELVEEYPQ